MYFSRRTLIASSAFVLSCALPALALAQQSGFVPLTKDADFQKIFGLTGASMGGGANDLGTFINSAFKIALSLGAILAVLRIAWAGYQYMSSDAWGEKSHAKEILGDVVIGLLLLLGTWLILYQINPDILNLRVRYVTPQENSSQFQNVQNVPTAPL